MRRLNYRAAEFNNARGASINIRNSDECLPPGRPSAGKVGCWVHHSTNIGATEAE
jgi:hypothetical protein